MQYLPELHEQTIDRLTRLLLRSPGKDEDVERWNNEMEQAVRHVAACQQCLVELDATLRVLSQGSDSIIPSCQDCAEHLGQAASLDEAGLRDRFPLVWLHLQLCDNCRSALVRLRNMVTREQAGDYGLVPGAPVFGASPMTTPFEVWQQVRAGVHRLALHIAIVPQDDEVTLRPVQDGRPLPIVQLPPGWRLEPVTVPIRRRAVGRKPGKVWSTVLPADCGMEIQLTAYPAGTDHLDLEVSVRTEQPIARARVTLTDEQGLAPWAEETDEQGTAFLAEISLERYNLEIAHAESAWLIPLDLSQA